MAEPHGTVRKGDTVAVRDAFDEWHPAIAETGVIRRGVSFPLVRCSLPLRGHAEVPFPAEDVLLLAAAALSGARTLRRVVAEPPQEGMIPRVPFEADHRGVRVSVTAVLERTAVVWPPGARAGEGVLARLDDVHVGELEWVLPDPDGKRVSAARGRRASARGRLRYGSHRDTAPEGYGRG